MRNPRVRFLWLAAVAVGVASVPMLGLGDDRPSLREGFESDRPTWRQEQTDVTVNLLDHDRSNNAAHEGRRSERFHFEAGPGSAFYYSYPLRKVPVADDLEVNLFVRSDHTGVQLFGRVILPADTDPDTGQPSFLLLPGTIYDTTDRWQRLNLGRVHEELERRVRVLRTKTKRAVSLEGAYLDRLVINLYGGPGESLVYLDDLSITPVPQELAAAAAPPAEDVPGAGNPRVKAPAGDDPEVPVAVPAPGTAKVSDRAKGAGDDSGDGEGKKEIAVPAIALERNRLFKGGKDWVFSSIRAPGADLKQLYRHGFDVLEVDLDGDPKVAREAVGLGFLLMPGLGKHPGSIEREAPDLVAMASEYSLRSSVAFWNVGDQLGAWPSVDEQQSEKERIRLLIDGIRLLPEGGSHLVTGTVAGLFPEFARPPHNLDLIGVDFPSWGTVQEIRDYNRYLGQRRDLTAVRNPEALHWAVINTSPPEEVHQAVWGFEPPESWGIARMQPEQVRLYTYAALQAGYRGLAFRGDADLTRASGRPLLIEMALLNAEIGLFESIVAQGFDPIPQLATYPPDPPIVIVYTSPGTQGGNNGQPGSASSFKSAKSQAKTRPEMTAHPSVTAASISTRDNKGKLLVIADLAQNGQWQPPQMAINDLQIRVPGAPDSAQAYEITLGGVNVLDHVREPGGIQVALKYFNTTSLVLVTTDRALVERIEAAVASVRSVAIQMAIEQARLQLAWVSEINGLLFERGHKAKDAKDLLSQADRSILSAEEALARAATTPDDYQVAWTEARRAGAALRLLMSDHFGRGLTKLLVASTPKAERLADAAEKASKVRPYTKARKNAGKPIPRKPIRIISPVSAPPAVAFNTLPQLFLWAHWIKNAEWNKSLLPSGLFDDPDPEALKKEGWAQEGYAYEGVSTRVATIAVAKEKPSPRFLKLSVGPEQGVNIDSLPPFLDAPAVAVRSPAVQVAATQLVRISVRVKKPKPQPPGAGGLIVRDSLGGEPLQYRNTNAIPEWAELILYRRAPADGPLTVTLGLAGFGEAYFDDLKIQLLGRIGEPDPAEAEDDDEDANNPYAQPAPRPRRRDAGPTARGLGRFAR